ncbi:hypothetical protein ZIOFF_045903 [Zingiber officinale]|uniref:Uncharacterized protein n=1 Tax=Zingiber officinale TaxID=94328 RepID=A0A8J5KYS5_ZINOF|nr:hypothetical protein ZIOFF_045903 [Zingiber officinale]
MATTSSDNNLHGESATTNFDLRVSRCSPFSAEAPPSLSPPPSLAELQLLRCGTSLSRDEHHLLRRGASLSRDKHHLRCDDSLSRDEQLLRRDTTPPSLAMPPSAPSSSASSSLAATRDSPPHHNILSNCLLLLVCIVWMVVQIFILATWILLFAAPLLMGALANNFAIQTLEQRVEALERELDAAIEVAAHARTKKTQAETAQRAAESHAQELTRELDNTTSMNL